MQNAKKHSRPNPDSEQQSRNDADQSRKREKPLAIRGTLDDVLRAAMNVKPKDEQKAIEGI